MKKALSFLFTLSIFLTASAQFNYPPSIAQNVSGTYTDLGTNGTVITTANFDDANSSATAIGFNFTFNGNSFSHFILNTNGFIKLGSGAGMSAPSATDIFFTTGNSYIDGIFNSPSPNDVNIISAFNHDLDAAASGAEFRVETSGSAGSQVCTIQYKNMIDKTTVPYNQFDSLSFQIKLYETTDVIEMVYDTWYASSDSSRFKSSACGIKGNNSTEITAVTKASTFAWDIATFISGNYTGNAFNFGNSNVGNGALPNGGRPMVDAGRTFRFTPAFNNDAAVDFIRTLGSQPRPYGLPHTISSQVSNVGLNTMNNVKVYLNVTGANTYTDSATIALLGVGTSQAVSFANYRPANTGVTDITISLSLDDNQHNDNQSFRQEVTDDVYSYIDTTAPNGGVGFNTGTGLILAKYNVTGKRYITNVEIFLNNDVAGNTMYAVVMSNAGTIIGQSPNLNATASNNSTWHTFDISIPPLVDNTPFYVGLAQLPNATTGYFPVGSVPEDPVRPGTYYSTGIGGSATPADFQAGVPPLNIQPAIRATAKGKNLNIRALTSPSEALCPSSSETISVTIQNMDSIEVDFSVDSLVLTASTTGPIAQSFNSTINTGTLAPGASQTFVITNNFDFSTAGVYNVQIIADIEYDVQTTNNNKTYPVTVLDNSASVTVIATSSNIQCFGTEVTFIATPLAVDAVTYQWKVDGMDVGPPTSDSSFTSSTLITSKVSAEISTNDCNASPITALSNEVSMVINPSPLEISGPDTVLENTTESYFFNPRPNSTMQWSVAGGTPNVTTGNIVNIDWGVAPTGTILITETDDDTCAYTTTFNVTIVSIVGTEEIPSDVSYLGNSYPNPTSENATIEFSTPSSENVTINLYNVTGTQSKNLFSGIVSGRKKITFSTNDLPPGLYFYEMNVGGERLVKRMSVIK